METFSLILFMLAAVLVSSVIAQLVPLVSAPLVQICLGFMITLIAGTQIDLSLMFSDETLFLVLFIAPLLYNEAKNANVSSLMQNLNSVLSLAIGLVLATALFVGISVYAMIGVVGFAAACALGGALGPTDPVSVAALSKETNIDNHTKALLSGEALINDASGIVAFQFAITLAITGQFSALSAAGAFFVQFFGGLIAGLLFGFLSHILLSSVRSWGLENTTFHVLFDLFTPFMVFLLAEWLGVSGILAVVSTGILNNLNSRALGPATSRMNIVSGNVWNLLSFALNGCVFVLLGTQLPRAMQSTWESVTISNGALIFYICIITLILVSVRFIWAFVIEYKHHKTRLDIARTTSPNFTGLCREALILTLGGPKGAITLAVILSMPRGVNQQQLIVFLASGVIVATLLLATFIVPVLAPKKIANNTETAQNTVLINIEILRKVIEQLSAQQNNENKIATQLVIHSYNQRIERLKDMHGFDNDNAIIALRIQALEWEQDYVMQLLDEQRITPFIAYRYVSRLSSIESRFKNHGERPSFERAYRRIRMFLRSGVHRILSNLPGKNMTEETEQGRNLNIWCCEYIVSKLEELLVSEDSTHQTEQISALILEYESSLMTLKASAPAIEKASTDEKQIASVKRAGLNFELEEIQNRYEEGSLTYASAKKMRENVFLMMIDLEERI